MKAWLVLLLAACSSMSRSAEALRYRLNGLEVEATYARGVEARSLVARFVESLPIQDAERAPGWVVNGSWRQIGRIEGSISHVLQVRGEGQGFEAITSALDTSQLPSPEPRAPFGLPPVSTLASQVQFLRPTASSQWVYRSAWRPRAIAAWLRLSAGVRGWHVDAPGGDSELQLSRLDERVAVQVLPEERSRGGGSVVVMTAWRAR